MNLQFFHFLCLAFLLITGLVRSQNSVSLREEEYVKTLNEEEKKLTEACDFFTKTDFHFNLDNYSAEEMVISMKALLCSAKDKTSTILDKLSRLRQSSIYSKCFVDKQCRMTMPAFDGLEGHFEARSVMFNSALGVSKDFQKILPDPYEQPQSDIEEMLESFQTIFRRYELPFESIVLPNIKLIGLLLAVIAVKCMDLKTLIWIFILFWGLFIFKNPHILQYWNQRETMLADLEHIQIIKITKSIWDFAELKQVSLHRDMKQLKEATMKLMNDYQMSLPSYQDQLRSLEKVGLSDLAKEANISYQKFEDYIKSLTQILVQSRSYFLNVKNSFEAIVEMKELNILHLKRFIKTIFQESIDIEESYGQHKKKFLFFISELNDLSEKARKFEDTNDNIMNKIKLGVLGAAVILNPATLIFAGKNSLSH